MGCKLKRWLALAILLSIIASGFASPVRGDGPSGAANLPAPVADGGFLSSWWRDVGVLATLIGLGATCYQVQQAIIQSRKATTAAQAATAAAVVALNESRKKYNNHIVNRARKTMSEASIYVKASDWACVCLRLSDLVDHLTEIADDDSRWHALAERLRAMEISFEKVRRGATYSPSLDSKWIFLKSDLSEKLNQFLLPFPSPDGAQNDK